MRKVLTILFVAGALVVFGGRANADTCSTDGSGNLLVTSGGTCTVELTQTNTTELIGSVVLVTIDDSGANLLLTFELEAGSPLYDSFHGFIAAGWEGAEAATGIPSGWSDTSPSNLDGFGHDFDHTYAFSGNPGGIYSVTFTLPAGTSSFSLNDGNWFGVHAQYDSGCSGWIGGPAGPSSVGSNSNCTPVPEPATLTLLGTGLLGLAGVVRRRLRLKK